MQPILIVDDLESIHEMLEAVIQPIGYTTVFATSGEMALEKLRQDSFEIILTDINMEPMDGLELLSEIKKVNEDAVVIMMSGYADVENATQSLKLGAFDFITKPFKVDQLISAINRASEKLNKQRAERAGATTDMATILAGNSDYASQLRESIEKHATAHTPVLITGELGTQKASIATSLHSGAEEADGPFICIDARELAEEEFHKKIFDGDSGAGEAVNSAKGGTLFIENIDHAPKKSQIALSDLIRDLKGEVRIISSSSRELEPLVESGEYEEALFIRIGTATIEVPTLRERAEDLPSIVMSFLGKGGLSDVKLSDQATALMQAYRWGGNYSELKEVLDAVVETLDEDKVIHAENLPDKLSDMSGWPSLEEFLGKEGERYKSRVLNACQGDREQAAGVLKCDPSDL